MGKVWPPEGVSWGLKGGYGGYGGLGEWLSAALAGFQRECGSKAAWQDMKEKAPEELGALEGECFLEGGVLGVAVAEGDGLLAHVEDALVGDADLVGVAAEISEHLPGSGEGAFGEDDPLFISS